MSLRVGRSSLGALSSFTMRSGVAIASDSEQLSIFKGLQRAINAFIIKRGLSDPQVNIDGQIGARTLDAFLSIAAYELSKFSPLPDVPTTVNGLAEKAEAMAKAIAIRAGVTTVFSPQVLPGDKRGSTSEGGGGGTVPDAAPVPGPNSGPSGGRLALALGLGAGAIFLLAAARDKRRRR